MNEQDTLTDDLKQLNFFFWAGAILWTLVLGASLIWNVNRSEEDMNEMARIQARSTLDRDQLYRQWNADLGGLYTPVTDRQQPNPHLKVPHRDLQTDSAQSLTLINPSYMTRQVYDLGHLHGIHGHLTSLHPIRPENGPDEWEQKALTYLTQGGKEVSEIKIMDDGRFMRMMIPLKAETACLNCHNNQGLSKGDLLGGLSVAIPLKPIARIQDDHLSIVLYWHMVIWLIGAVGLVFAQRRVRELVLRQHEAQEIIRQQALHDPLTGLPNRRLFFDRLHQLLNSRDLGQKSVALLYLDLDGFKGVNDQYGHQIGDRLLQRTAVTVSKTLRDEDTLARIGGDEFCIILPRIDRLDDVRTVATRILKDLSRPIIIDNHSCNFSTSIGIALAPGDASMPDDLLHKADLAMYKAKRQGRNRFVVYSS